MIQKRLFIFLLLVVSLSFIEVLAVQPPGIPHAFYGKVYFSDGPAPDGLEVIAKIEDEEFGRTTTSGGKYGNPYLIVTDPNNENEGKTISFFVAGYKAKENATFKNGEVTELDLTLDVPSPRTTTTTTVAPTGPTGPVSPLEETTTTISEITTTTIPNITPTVKIDVVKLKIPSEVYAYKPFILEVKLKNIGEAEGSDRITLSLPEGWTADEWSETVHLLPDEETTLHFTITPNNESGEIAVGSSSDFERSGEIFPLVEETTIIPSGITGFAAVPPAIDWRITGITVVILLSIILFLFRKRLSRKEV